MSGIALGAAYAAVQLVHQAHSKVKTSKARCARLVERCQFVIDRLERIAATKGGDAIIKERINELERAFERTAWTIVQVGQQGVIASLLRAEANALRIEACNEVLTELISLFNLEEIVDVRRWQTDLEVARVRDHHELLNMGQRIESDNAAINRELAQQGATIAEVLRGIHDINAVCQKPCFNHRATVNIRPMTDASATSTPQMPTLVPASTHLPKAKVSGSSASKPSAFCISCDSPKSAGAAAAAAKPNSPVQRRLSFTRKCIKMVPLANVFSKSSSFHSPPRSAATTRTAKESLSLSTVRHATGERPLVGDSNSSTPSRGILPTEPPPPYQLRVVNPAPASSEYDRGHDPAAAAPAATMSSSSRFTAASIEAIRAPDSPVPTFPSPKLSTESVFGSTQSLASVSDSVFAPAKNGTGTIPDSGSRCCTGTRHTRRNPAAGDTIGFARRMTLSSGHHSAPTVSSAPFRS